MEKAKQSLDNSSLSDILKNLNETYKLDVRTKYVLEKIILLVQKGNISKAEELLRKHEAISYGFKNTEKYPDIAGDVLKDIQDYLEIKKLEDNQEKPGPKEDNSLEIENQAISGGNILEIEPVNATISNMDQPKDRKPKITKKKEDKVIEDEVVSTPKERKSRSLNSALETYLKKEGISDVVIHGRPEVLEDGSLNIKSNNDLDSSSALKVLDYVGAKFADGSKTTWIDPNEEIQYEKDGRIFIERIDKKDKDGNPEKIYFSPGTLVIDVGNTWGVKLGRNDVITVDHHKEDAYRPTSATKLLVEALEKAKIFKDGKAPEWLKNYSRFVTADDNLDYEINPKDFSKIWPSSLYGIKKLMGTDALFAFFEKYPKVSPNKLTPEQKEFKFTKRIQDRKTKEWSEKEFSISEIISKQRNSVNTVNKKIEEVSKSMESNGLNIDSPELGKVLFDAVEDKSSIGLGTPAVYGAGYDTYVMSSKKSNSFFISSRKDLNKLYYNLKTKIPNVKLVRDHMVILPIGSKTNLDNEQIESLLKEKLGINKTVENESSLDQREKDFIESYIAERKKIYEDAQIKIKENEIKIAELKASLTEEELAEYEGRPYIKPNQNAVDSEPLSSETLNVVSEKIIMPVPKLTTVEVYEGLENKTIDELNNIVRQLREKQVNANEIERTGGGQNIYKEERALDIKNLKDYIAHLEKSTISEKENVRDDIGFRFGKIEQPQVITTVEQYENYLKHALLNKPTAEKDGIMASLDKAEEDIKNTSRMSNKEKSLGLQAINNLRKADIEERRHKDIAYVTSEENKNRTDLISVDRINERYDAELKALDAQD